MSTLSQLPWKSVQPSISLQHDEHLIDAFSTHWVKYVVPVFFYVLIEGAGLAVLLAFFTQPASILTVASIVLLVPLVFIHHWFFHRMLSSSLDSMLLTNKRLIVLRANLWFDDDDTEFPLVPMRTVEASKHGFLQHLLNYGTISFDVPGSTIRMVPSPHYKATEIAEILKAYGPVDRAVPAGNNIAK